MANHFNPEVFSNGELEIIITAATRLTELLRKSQSFDSDLEMYEKFDEWRTCVNINCIAFNELKRRNTPKSEV